MTFGIRMWDANGNIVLDSDDIVLMIIGTLELPASTTQSGSINVPGFSDGTPFYSIQYVELDQQNQFIGYVPTVSISGNTLSWSFPSIYGSNGMTPTTRIIYGIQ